MFRSRFKPSNSEHILHNDKVDISPSGVQSSSFTPIHVHRHKPISRSPRLGSLSSKFFRSSSLRRTDNGVSVTTLPDGNAEIDPLGLQIAYEPQNLRGDIVFVHGLGGSAWRTWCWDRDIRKFWPQWLADDETFSAYRISTFGYNARFRGEATNLSVNDFAKDLLLQLSTGLCRKDNTNGPIIFIAHSMGGLVVKKAYMLGKHDKNFSDLIANVFGIIFLATPHRGTQHAKVLNRILSVAPLGAPPKAYVADLERQSSTISDINENFRHHCGQLSLASFYETLKTNLHLSKVLIVEKDSAVLGLPNEVSASMDADHHTICKFRDRFDPNFVKLRGLLQSWHLQRQQPNRHTLVVRGRSHTENPRQAHFLLGMLDSGQPDGNLQSLMSLSVAGSGRWLTEKQEFIEWVNGPLQDGVGPLTFWMIGLPGKGKTVLSAHVIANLQSSDHRVQYHFFRQGHQGLQTIVSCLRSLAAQLAEQFATFREAVIDFHEETGITFTPENQTFQYLWEKIFVGILFKMQLNRPLWWVLDGIDESENPSLLIASLSAIKSRTPIKIYLSSRPLKFVSLLDRTRLTSYFLEDADTADDVRAYTQYAIRNEIPDDPELQKDVAEMILKSAHGSFLWVKLAIETLEDNWYTRAAIEAALTSVPSGMVAMYRRMIDKIDVQQPRNREMAKVILTWAACSWRPLSLVELKIALEPDFTDFTNFPVALNRLCGQFINIEQSSNATQAVSLIHATAREFLLEGDATFQPYIDAQEAHKTLGIRCLNYLSTERWRRHFASIHKNMKACKKGQSRDVLADETSPLLTYASCYWAFHVSRAPTDDPDVLEALKKFLNCHSLTWIEGIALAGDLQYVSGSGQYLKAYVKRAERGAVFAEDGNGVLSFKDSHEDLQWVQSWAVDLIRVVGKFGSNLLRNPPSIHKHVPTFSPKESMIAKAYGSSPSLLLTVKGLRLDRWDDCVASVDIGRENFASQILATETFFLTLVNTSGTITVWNTETCEKVKTIRQGEWVTFMALNKAGTLLATSGYRSFGVWDVSSGRKVYSFPRKSPYVVRDLKFSSDDKQLLIGLDNCTVTYHNLETSETDRIVIARLPDNDAGYVGCPGNVVISPDLTRVAMSWRGRAPLVWDLDHSECPLPYMCRVKGPSDPLLYPRELLWRPGTDCLLVLCNDTRLVEWRILDEHHIEYDHIGACDISVSVDGKFLLSRNHRGTISIWTIPQYDLVYSLLNPNEPSSAMTFSPHCKRFYDIRGSMCNVWEPDTLVRPDEQDLEDTSSSGRSFSVTDPVTFPAGNKHVLITAMGMTPRDKYFCCGREDGSIIIVDSQSGKRLRKVYTHNPPGDVLVLAWSNSGKYMASCDEFGHVMAKRLQVKAEGQWAVFALFESRLKDNALQLLFSPDDNFLLVSTQTEDFVWDLKTKQAVVSRSWVSEQARCWTQHPSNPGQLIWTEPSLVRMHNWPALEQLAEISIAPHSPTARAKDVTSDRPLAPEPSTSRHPDCGPDDGRRTVQWATTVPTKSCHLLIYATLPQERSIHWASDICSGGLELCVLSLADLASPSAAAPSPTLLSQPPNKAAALSRRSYPISGALVSQIKFLLGTLASCVVFLDHEGWIYTYDVASAFASFASSASCSDNSDNNNSNPSATNTSATDIPTINIVEVGGGGPLEQQQHHHHHHHHDGTASPMAGDCDTESLEGLTRHFFAPKDWLATNTSHLTLVHGEKEGGTLFCPRYGEVAIVRGGLRM